MPLELAALPARLAALAEHYDTHACWPQRSLELLAEAGGWRWALPRQYGGAGLAGPDLLAAYQSVARGCLATALILTQRDGACDLIAGGENEELKTRLLRAYARAERFTSIGVAQLTAAPHGRRPAVRAQPVNGDYLLDGVIPWVTGASQCDEIVTGAVLPDGQQLLACIPCDNPALSVEPPLPLLALGASCTSRVRLTALRLTPADIIRGPAEVVLTRRAPVKPLVASAVGLGLAAALRDRLVDNGTARAAETAVRPLLDELERLTSRLAAAAAQLDEGAEDVPAQELRAGINVLVMRLGMVHLTLAKGAGYTRPHPAERLLREAALFLVWSISPEVQAQTLRLIAG